MQQTSSDSSCPKRFRTTICTFLVSIDMQEQKVTLPRYSPSRELVSLLHLQSFEQIHVAEV